MRRRGAPNIYLIGLMGSGKSTVGRALARRLGREFVDTDRVIEKMAGRPIRQIFARHGEKYFRRLEQRAIAQAAGHAGILPYLPLPLAGEGRGEGAARSIVSRTARKPGRVIAVGGGAVTNSGNVSVMKRTGIIVYLQVPVTTALRRVESEGIAKRPLLSGHSRKKRLRILNRLLAARRPLYFRCSDIRVRAGSGRPVLIAERVANRISAYSR